MQFFVPQFIDIEDKIFGPLSFKQFAYLVGGGGLSYLLYELLPLYVAIPLIIPTIAFALALAFYQVNNKPFIEILQAGLRYVIGKKLYIWKKEPKPIEPQKREEPQEETLESYIPKLSDSKLKDLSWSLGVKDSLYSGEEKYKGK